MARPLTKRDRSGNIYQRPASIEGAINAALVLGTEVLGPRARIRDPGSSGYLPSECLVHLIRDAHRNQHEERFTVLFQALLARCLANLNSTIFDSGVGDAVSLREEVLGQFAELFATEETNELDFFECKFDRAFKTFRVDLLRHAEWDTQHFAPIAERSDDPDPDEEERYENRADPGPSAGTIDHAIFAADLFNALMTLSIEERRAVILCHYLGYETESKDPAKQTAATLCHVTGRTIRNYLNRAAKKLSALEKEFLS